MDISILTKLLGTYIKSSIDITFLLALIISYFVTFQMIPFWRKRAMALKISGKDIHKIHSEEVAEMGGITIMMGFTAGLMVYIALLSYYNHNIERIALILAVMSSISIGTIVGILDDILGWKIGLKQWQKPLMMLFAALPLMALSFKYSFLYIPLVSSLDIGIFYALLVIPITLIGTSNGFNMVGGYNGLETGMGIILLSSISFLSIIMGSRYVALIGFIMVFALLAFLQFNKFPAKIFPGDTMTYSVGALFGILALMSHLEIPAGLMFIIYIVQFILKARGKMKKESFSALNPDGSLKLRYDGIYGVEHVALVVLKKFKKKVYEKDIVHFLWVAQLIVCIIVVVPFAVVY